MLNDKTILTRYSFNTSQIFNEVFLGDRNCAEYIWLNSE